MNKIKKCLPQICGSFCLCVSKTNVYDTILKSHRKHKNIVEIQYQKPFQKQCFFIYSNYPF